MGKKKRKERVGYRKSWPRYKGLEETLKSLMMRENRTNHALWPTMRTKVFNSMLTTYGQEEHGRLKQAVIASALAMEKAYELAEDAVILFPKDTSMVQYIHNIKLRLEPDDLLILPEFVEIRFPQNTKINNINMHACRIYNVSTRDSARHCRDHNQIPDYQDVFNKHFASTKDEDTRTIIIDFKKHSDQIIPTRIALNMEEMANVLDPDQAILISSVENTVDDEYQQKMNLHHTLALKVAFYSLTGNATNDLPQQYMPKEDKITFTLTSPKTPKSVGTSPSMHWRHAHMRRYPIRSDGTRKAGIVLVCGSVVNREKKAQTLH